MTCIQERESKSKIHVVNVFRLLGALLQTSTGTPALDLDGGLMTPDLLNFAPPHSHNLCALTKPMEQSVCDCI